MTTCAITFLRELLPRPSVQVLDRELRTDKDGPLAGARVPLPVEDPAILLAFEANQHTTAALGTRDGSKTQTHGRLSDAWPNSLALTGLSHGSEGHWRCSGSRSTVRSTSCDRAAWAHSIIVAAAKGRGKVATSLLLHLANFHPHVAHDRLWQLGKEMRFQLRLLAFWCGASYEGSRF